MMVAPRLGRIPVDPVGSEEYINSVQTHTELTRCEDSPSYQATNCPEVQKNAKHENDGTSVRVHGRSLSHDRRNTEFAQFLEAVGESSVGAPEIEIVDSGGEDSPDEEDYGTSKGRARKIPLKERVVPPFNMLPSSSCIQQGGHVREDLEYRGIGDAGLEITKCGVQRGNHVTLHRKAWLEVSDSKHRYGKNLRVYYRHWCSLGYPTNNFFQWLDSLGEAEGRPLPDLQDCPRKQLETDTVLYITDKRITDSYSLSVVTDKLTRRAKILDVEGEAVRTGTEGWIFVLRDDTLYASRKVTALSAHSKQRFHHSSFFGGKAVSAAGILITDQDGYLTQVHPHSGHYRPGESDLQRCLAYLHSTGVGFDTFDVDMQQIFHVSRNLDSPVEFEQERKDVDTKKKQKKTCLFLMPACFAAYFLSHNAKAKEVGIFKQITNYSQP